MSKKVIVHLIQSLDSGGCENMLLRTLPLMKKFDHVIITLNKRGNLADKFEGKGVRVVNINQKSLVDLFSYRRLKIKIKQLKPNLIITYLFHADLIGRLYLQSISKIKVVPFLRTTYNHKNYWQARLFEKLTKGLVYEYLANSEAVKDYYVNQIGVKKNNITVIPNGIDIDYYNSIPKDLTLRKNMGIKLSDTVIICVANLHVNKGHKYLLEAFELLYKTNKNIKLLLVGDGVEKENLLNQIYSYHSKNYILFLGNRNDVPLLLKISDIFVLPTLFEGMSNAILEAMAVGLPVISTKIPENISILGANDLVESESSESIYQKLFQYLSGVSLSNMIIKQKKIIKSNFDLSIVSKDFENYLQGK
ncbi:MAG: glycosyltransferase [Microgenomates group bacterium]